jgi:DNA-binding beta-propeller fold protein YncE
MANTIIQIKSSGVVGNVPTTLVPGELAINYEDGKLYYGNSTSQVELFDVITEPAGLNGEIQFNDSGSFGSDQFLIYDTTNKSLTANNLFAGTMNVAPTVLAAYTHANTVNLTAQAAFDEANTANSQAWIAYHEAVNANTWVRQRADSAGEYANSAYIQANTATILAQYASDYANTITSISGFPEGDYGYITDAILFIGLGDEEVGGYDCKMRPTGYIEVKDLGLLI